MTADDAEDLRQILLEVVKTQEALLARRDEFGQRYTIDFTLKWQDKSATLRSGWIIEHDSDIAALSCMEYKLRLLVHRYIGHYATRKMQLVESARS